MGEKLSLYGFNNLTKTLSFNIYDVCYAKTQTEQEDYLAYIDEQYNSTRLTHILRQVTELIGAQILNISRQDYEPQGASVNILIAEQNIPDQAVDPTCNLGRVSETETAGKAAPGAGEVAAPATLLNTPTDAAPASAATAFRSRRDTVHAHLDKSHVTVHTFPESHPDNAVCTFRVDIDVQTCGTVSPLNILDFLIASFDSDIITIDYRVRGFTRDITGKKFFMDRDFQSIQNYIDNKTLRQYDAIDVNVYQANIWHTKMLIKEKEFELQNYLFNTDALHLPPHERLSITKRLRQEMFEIFSGNNIY